MGLKPKVGQQDGMQDPEFPAMFPESDTSLMACTRIFTRIRPTGPSGLFWVP